METTKTLTIQDVHDDINTSYLETTQLVHEIIERDKVSQDKLKLYNLGFKKFEKEVLENKEQIKAEQIYQQITRYKVDYPYHKFITYDGLAKIIDKYDLVLSTPERFIGDIPENNIKDILRFKLKEQDTFNFLLNSEISEGINFTYRENGEDLSHVISAINHHISKINNLGLGRAFTEADLISFKDYFGEDFFNMYYFQGHFPESFYINDNLFKIKNNIHYHNVIYITSISKKHQLKVKEFQICENTEKYPYISNSNLNLILGTQDQFKLNIGESFINGSITNIDMKATIPALNNDPIVLVPVMHGFIVKTMWGAEALLDEVKDVTLN